MLMVDAQGWTLDSDLQLDPLLSLPSLQRYPYM
jgi:hypothetical protein